MNQYEKDNKDITIITNINEIVDAKESFETTPQRFLKIRKVILCILDGFGIRQSDNGNAIKMSNLPNLNEARKRTKNEINFINLLGNKFFRSTILTKLVNGDNFTMPVNRFMFYTTTSTTGNKPLIFD